MNSFLKFSLTIWNEVEQPLARLVIEAVDALAQPPDRFDQIVALAGEFGVLAFDLLQFLLGEQIHRAEPLAFLLDALDLGLDLGDRRHRRVGLELGDFGGRHRLDAQSFADLVFDVGAAADGGIVALLGAGGFGARFADRFERSARRLVGLGKIGFGRRQPVGGGAALGRRGLDLADQRLALGGEFFRRVGEFGALARGFFAALLDGGDLRRGAVLALAPGLPLAGDGLQAMIGKFGLARERLRLDPHFGAGAALARDGFVDRGKLVLRSSTAGGSAASACSASSRAALASSRLAPMRCLASVSAERRAALRLISRSAAAWSSRAASVQVLRLAPAARALRFRLRPPRRRRLRRASTAWRFVSTSLRAAASSPSIACRRPRSASRRAAPVGACAATAKPSQRQKSPSGETSLWPGLSSVAARRAPSARATTPIWASRRASSGGALTYSESAVTPSGSAGSDGSSAAPAQRIGADSPTGASRSSPKAAPSAFS